MPNVNLGSAFPQFESSTSQNLLDDVALTLGTGGTASLLWETADANANAFVLSLPTGGAVDVPVLIIGQGVTDVDLGLYNGVVAPRIALFGIGAVATAPVWEFRKARGTIAAPTVITTGDDLGSINAWACVAAGEWKQSAAIEFDSTGTIATTRGPGLIRFKAATDAAPSVLTDVLTVTPLGIQLRGPTNPGFLLKAVAGPAGAIRNEADSAYLPMYFLTAVCLGDFNFETAGSAINSAGSGAVLIKAFDTGVARVEVASFQSGANPWFQIGRDDTGVALNAVTDMLVLQAGGGTGNESANFGLGISIKLGNASSEVEERASIDTVLVVATNAAEEARMNFNLQIAGAAPALVGSLTKTGPIFPLMPNADPSIAGMLYYIAATGVVMRSAG